MQQRYYDPMIPRFLSVDPVTAYDDPVGQFHRYRYANSSPQQFVDVDGRQANDPITLPSDCGEDPCENPALPPPTPLPPVVATASSAPEAAAPIQELVGVTVVATEPSSGTDSHRVDVVAANPRICPPYGERYMQHLDTYLLNVGPYASALVGGLWPKSWAPATGGRGPLLGSRNPLTSVPRAVGIRSAGGVVGRTGAAGIGMATVAVGSYNVGVFTSGLLYAIPEDPRCK